MTKANGFAALVVLCAMALSGCEDEGPAERAGQTLDNALSEAQDRFEDARDEIEEAAEEIDEALRGE